MSKTTYTKLPAASLSVDPAVQRGLSGPWATKLTGAFNPEYLGTLTVSIRDDGTIVILDGQHRHAAAVAAGYDDLLPCIAHHGLTIEEEARIFAELNTTKPVQATDRFNVRVVGGDPVAIDIQRLLNLYGWKKVALGQSQGHFSAVAALERVYNGAGILKGPTPQLAKDVLRVINDAYGTDPQGAHAAIVGGVGSIIARYGKRVDLTRLSAVMAKEPPPRLVGKIRSLKDLHKGPIGSAAAQVLVGLYNSRLRPSNQLPDWTRRSR